MKLVTVQFNDSVNLSGIVKGEDASVVTTVTVAGGKIMAISDVLDPEPELTPHNHPAAIGPAMPL